MKKDVNVYFLIKFNSLSGTIILKRVCSGTVQHVWICQGLLTACALAIEAKGKGSYSKLRKTLGKTSRRQGKKHLILICSRTRFVSLNKACWEWMPRDPEAWERLGRNLLGYQVTYIGCIYNCVIPFRWGHGTPWLVKWGQALSFSESQFFWESAPRGLKDVK